MKLPALLLITLTTVFSLPTQSAVSTEDKLMNDVNSFFSEKFIWNLYFIKYPAKKMGRN